MRMRTRMRMRMSMKIIRMKWDNAASMKSSDIIYIIYI